MASLVVAIPLAYYLTNIWLDEFVYRIDNGFSIYLFTVLLVGLIILLSVGYQSLKASRIAPSKVLRDE